MFYLVSVLIIVVAILLTLVVLVQNSKGGGLASNFSSSNQVMGVRKTADFLEKATWGLAISLVVLCIAASVFVERGDVDPKQTALEEQLQQVSAPVAVDPAAITAPVETTEEGTKE